MKEIYTKPESVVEEFQTVSSAITTSTEELGDLE